MILTAIAHDVGADLGKAYNAVMYRAREDDWVCFIDHDAVFTTRTWYKQLCDAVEKHPDAGLFSVMTNRVGNPEQEIILDQGRDNHDMKYHRKIGKEIADGVSPTITTASGSVLARMPEYMELDQSNSANWLSGVVMLTSKRAWSQVIRDKKIGFPEGYFMGLDNFYHEAQKRLGNPVFLLTRVYVYHWYRADGDNAHERECDGRRSYRP